MENTFENKLLLSETSDQVRVDFYKKTYAHVAGGILLFVLFEYFLLQSSMVVDFMLSMTEGWKWLVMLGGFMFITNYAESTALKTSDKNMQYLAYVVYIFAEALIFVPLLFFAIYYTEGVALVQQAAIVTLTLFVGISAVVFITKKDFSFLKAGLTVGFFIAIGLIIAGT